MRRRIQHPNTSNDYSVSLSSSLKSKDNENFVNPKTNHHTQRPMSMSIPPQDIPKANGVEKMKESNSYMPQRIKFPPTLSEDYSAKKKALTSTINDIWKLDRKSNTSNQKAKLPSRVGKVGRKPLKKGQFTSAFRKLWRRRHARSIEEGIRRERVSGKGQTLSEILEEHQAFAKESEDRPRGKRKYAARTIRGLIKALAEEATGLEVEVDSRKNTPLWGKHVDELRINFDRLGFRQLRMGGLEDVIHDTENKLSPFDKETIADSLTDNLRDINEKSRRANSPDEVFDRIDTDNSGALDEEELARALLLASGVSGVGATDDKGKKSTDVLGRLASSLVGLYDTNGDGVVDREEYKKLVQDMTALRSEQRLKQMERKAQRYSKAQSNMSSKPQRWRQIATNAVLRLSKMIKIDGTGGNLTLHNQNVENYQQSSEEIMPENLEDISNDASIANIVAKGEGSIVFSDLKVDLRRLLFGSFPIIKKV